MRRLPAFLALACLLAAGSEAVPDTLPESLLGCTNLEDPGARLRCYDTQVAAIKAATPASAAANALPAKNPAPSATRAGAAASAAAAPHLAPAPTPAPATAAPALAAPAAPTVASTTTAPPPSPAAQFGQDSIPHKLRPPETADERVLRSSITAVREVRPKTFLISLANGQVWRQDGSTITMFFRPGYDARIEKGALGSYHMSTSATGEKNWVLVTRIQ